MIPRRWTRWTALAALVLITAPADPPPPQEPVRFNRDIRPILAENCFACHGPDPAARQTGLRFDREEGFFGAREGGPTVVRGKPEASPLFRRISSSDREEVMPPPKAKKSLKPAQKELLRRWIAQGAPWEPHWAFIRPERPPLPPVKDEKWIRNAIDRFVLARLEAAGLSPAPEADRRALARRLWLDVTGLPPEPGLVEAFAGDPSPEAYAKLLDRLLQSPRYGEHRARYWLDAARYADTHGLHFDNFREIWPYRDWVIDAFNRNLPFDRFTVEQLAGDLLPGATPEQILATGFHRCNMTTNEGGTIAEENLANYARDRVETTSWVWLGLTANCAVCHDHKFDPIPMKDFYSMSAFFRNTTQGALDGNVSDTAPVLVMPRPEDAKRWDEISRAVDAANREIADRRKALRAEFNAWLDAARPGDWDAEVDAIGPPALHLPLRDDPPGDAVTGTAAGRPVTGKFEGPVRWEPGAPLGKAPVLPGKAPLRLEGPAGDFEKDAGSSWGAWIKAPPNFPGAASPFARMDDDAAFRGWDLHVQGREFAAHLIHAWPNDAIKVSTTGRLLKPGTWQHVFVTYDGSGKAAGFRLFVDGREAKLKVDADTLKSSVRTAEPLVVGQRKKGSGFAGGAIQDIRLYSRRLAGGEVRILAAQPLARRLLARAPQDRPAKEGDELFDARSGADPRLSEAAERISSLEAERKAIRERGSVSHIMEEKSDSMPAARVLFRGEYDKPRDPVGPAVFGALHPLRADAPRNRLGLAQWIVSRENPITPRVVVNRFWQEVFGAGIVRTAEDFGVMGEPPSHPELLDHLAAEFRDGGFDVKKLFRLMLSSATYRQASVATPEKLRKDPANRLLSRGPRYRMDAEMIRDAALSSAGLLSPKVGGPSVKPYQPDGVWDAVGMRESNTKTYKPDSGEALYRRSLYTFWKRMAPPASMEILNAPAREFSCLRRERTNTPLQALVTLNDPQFVEAARALAERALKAGGDDALRLDATARRALSRPLQEREAAVVRRILEGLRAHYRANPDDARALVAVGESKADAALDAAELASWTMVSNQLLNLDEALNK